MFPYRDENPTQHFSYFTLLLIVANVAVWVGFEQMGFSDAAMARALCDWGMIPGELTGLSIGARIPISSTYLCVVDPVPNYLTLLSMQFLHGGWMHLIGNMLFLWVFGNNVEDAMGHVRYLSFYLACGLVAALAQLLIDPASPVPTVGASGAVSGVLGAYLLLYPRARVWMVFPILIFPVRFSLPAWVFLIYWAGLQVLSGVVDQLARNGTAMSGGVAFWAHVGGFAAGMFLMSRFRRPGFRVRRSMRW